MTDITVLMGIYNCADTLSEALDSLLAQTYSGWKCILCDDGSTDDTKKVAQKYVEEFPEYFYLIVNNKNLGLNQTLNNCLELADTEFVARMDGDDISLPTRFDKERSFLIENPEFDIVSTPMIQFDEDGDFRVGTATPNPTKEQIVVGSHICHAPCMIRTSAIKSVGGYTVSDKILRVEDVDLWIKLYSNGYRCHNLSEPLYKMRDDRNATARRKYKYRINSTRVRLNGCKLMDLGIKYKIQCLLPMIIGLIPKTIYTYLHRNKQKYGRSS